MSPALLQRQAALAAGALLATLGVLALDRGERATPLPPVRAEVRWETAVVGVLRARAQGGKTACGMTLGSQSLGVSHPVLPCGVDLVLSSEAKEIRTEVVERAAAGSGRDFELTRALARELGVERGGTLRWRFAD